MSVVADLGLTAADLLAKMPAGERAALLARFDREHLKDKSYLDLPMGREVGRYLAAKRKRLAATSARGWESCLEKFARQFADCSLEDFELPGGADLIEPWMDERWGTHTGTAPGTYNVNHAVIKDFFRWQVHRQRMKSNPMELVGRARPVQPHRETFTENECRALIANSLELRDRIALRLLAYHGLRKDELRKIQFKHFDYSRRKLTVFGKGSKVAPVPLPEPEFWTDLERHVQDVQADGEHYLMCVVKQIPYGTPDALGHRPTREHRFPDRPMTSTPLHNWFKARCRDAGARALHMHALRHTAGQRILDETGDLKLTQLFLRHANISTTGDTYVNYDIEQQAGRIAAAIAAAQADSDE